MQYNKRQTIMYVDDNKANLAMGKGMLEEFYDVYALPSADKLLQFLKRVKPDLILLDIEMPGMNGYEAMTMLKADKQYADIPVIFVTAKNGEAEELDGLELGAIDYVTKPFSAALLLKRIENHLLLQKQQSKLQDFNKNLLNMVKDKTAQIFGLQYALISTVADLVESRDSLTGSHVNRTQKYLEALVDQLLKEGIYEDEMLAWDMDIMLPSAQLHDLGKISISDTILNKPGKLTPQEYEIMKTHVEKGVDAIERMEKFGYFAEYLNLAKIFAATHHEKWDGSGYPQGLKEQGIPLEGRIMALVDVYDALISERPYKRAFSADESAQIIVMGSGTHFDPAIVAVFEKLAGEFAGIAQKYSDQRMAV